MNTLLYTKSFVLALFYQSPLGPGGPGGGGDTGIDAAPIDDYLIAGLIVGMLLIVVFFKSIRKSEISTKTS